MPNPTTNFKNSDGIDLGNILITKEYLMTVYPQIVADMITPELWSWGRNDTGELGDNTTVDRSTPVQTFTGGTNWKQVSCGGDHTAAIKTDGTLWTWGYNYYGQLGNNLGSDRRTPVQTLNGGTNWKQVACGVIHTAAIKTDGTLWTWGNNYYGQLGINNLTRKSTPVQTLNGGTNWKQVSGGYGHTAAIKTDGTLWTWGRNDEGQLGTNATTNRCTPVQTFTGGTNWKQVSCGGDYTAAIKTDGTLWSWGNNGYGQLGTNDTTRRRTPVQTFTGGTNWKQVSCGSAHTAAIKTDGTLWTWGCNDLTAVLPNTVGALGDNTTTNRCTPVQTFTGGTNWKQVACGNFHTAAVKTDGTLWTWGSNGYGQLGTNATTNRCTPVQTLNGGTNWKQVSCGGSRHTAAIKTSDDLLGI